MKRFRLLIVMLITLMFALPAIDSENFASEAKAQVVEVTGNNVRLRTGPGTSYGEYAKLNKGKRLEYNYTTGDWYCVNYEGYKLFVNRDFACLRNNTIAEEKPAAKAKADTYSFVKVTGDGVRLRKGPGANYEVYTKVNKGTKLTYVKTVDDWYCVKYKDQVLYISRDFASLSK